jgi:ABC-type dipeptide/oligopeptide/nickel transport system permease component
MTRIALFTMKRFVAMVVVVFAIMTITFFLAHLSPFDPIKILLGERYLQDKQAYYQLRHLYGLDQPMWQQYLTYLGRLLHGNLGYSQASTTMGQSITQILLIHLPVSLKLGGLSLLVALLVGLPAGLLSALKQDSLLDHGTQFATMLAFAVPVFVIAPIAQYVFGVRLGWLPVSGWGDPGVEGVKEMVLPVALFAAGMAGYFAKSFRSFLLEVLREDYIRTARAKGLKERRVIYLHAIKNTLLPLVTIIGPTIAFLVTGAFIIENFFSIPGIGNITALAALQSDYSMIQATTLVLSSAVVLLNFLTDVVYTLIDPRIEI